MDFFRKLFSKTVPKKSADKYIDDIVKKVYKKKGKDGYISDETMKKISEEFVNKILSGELEFSSDENWEAPEVEISTHSEKALSKNSQFSVHWQDGYAADDKWKSGIVVLREKGVDVWKKYVDRPFNCNVANSGTVICNDSTIASLKYSKNISCRFFAFDISGNLITDYLLTANIGDVFLIDSNGEIAVFNTLYSDTSDADSYFVFSLKTNEILEQFEDENREVIKALIDEATHRVILKLKGEDEFEINF